MSKDKKLSNLKNLSLLFIAVSFIFISLARPRWDYIELDQVVASQNLVILLDSSNSMTVNDIKPSRFIRAKQEINDILKNIDDSRVGLISFTEIPHIISPLTKDKNAILDNIRSLSPKDFNIQGSNINEALRMASNYFKKLEKQNKFILLISDGDFELNFDAKLTAELKEQQIKIFIYGVGTEIGGPVFSDGKIIEYKGKKVISKLEKNNLLKLANKFDGKLSMVSYDDSDLKDFLSFFTKDKILEKSNIKVKKWHERFYLFLIPALIIFLYYFRIGALLIFIIFLNPEISYANIFLNNDMNAKKHFKLKEYNKSEEKFSSEYNKGVAAYRAKKYNKAIKYFAKDQDSTKSLFNLGNSHFMAKDYKSAISSYEKFLKIEPDHIEAKYNLEIAKKMLKNNQQNQQSNKQNKRKNKQDRAENKQEQNKSAKSQEESQVNQNDVAGFEEGKQQINSDQNIFDLIETDSGQLIKMKIRNKDIKNKNKLRGIKPW